MCADKWTNIFKADCILLVGLAEKTPSESMSHIVKQVESISMRVQKELVLMHREGILHPSGTVKWLNALGWLSSYFHVSSQCRHAYLWLYSMKLCSGALSCIILFFTTSGECIRFCYQGISWSCSRI